MELTSEIEMLTESIHCKHLVSECIVFLLLVQLGQYIVYL